MGVTTVLFLYVSFLAGSIADYSCVCNYNVELFVYSTMSEQSAQRGSMFEFDCKESVPWVNASQGWAAVAFEHNVGYIKINADVNPQICPGDPSNTDTVTTTVGTTLSGQSGATSTQLNGASSTYVTTPIVQSSRPTKTSPVYSSTTAMTPMSQSSTQTATTTASPTTVTTTAPRTSSATHAAQSTTGITLSPSTLTEVSSTVTTTSSTAVPQSSTEHTTTAVPHSSTEHTTTAATIVLHFTNATAATTTITAPTCHKRSSASITTTFGLSCYEVVPYHTSWNHAESDCKRRGGHLMHILNVEEQQFITRFLLTHYNHEVWIGLGDRHHEEHFEWSSGVPLSYTHWDPSRKDVFIHALEDCVALQPNEHGYWDDRQCSGILARSHSYVCQYSGKHSGSVIIG